MTPHRRCQPRLVNVFEQATKGIADEDRIELLLSYVTKDALRWYAQFVTPHVGSFSWSAVRRMFVSKFSRLSVQPIIAAKNRILQPKESVQTYFDEKTRLLELARQPQEAMVALLTDGMPDTYRTVISANGPQTITQWLEVTQRYEVTRRQEQKSIAVAAVTQLHRKPQPDKKYKPSAAADAPPKSPCPICLRNGRTEMHWARVCPSKQTKPKQVVEPAVQSLNSNGGPRTA